jgi:hypothetical protein
VKRAPLPPAAWHAAARRLRAIADQLDARAAATTSHERAALTRCVNALALYARALAARHRARAGDRFRTPSAIPRP